MVASVRAYGSLRRAYRGARGSGGAYVLDHYDRSAIDNYLHTVGDRLMQAFGTRRPNAVFCDSLEVFASDWTPDLLDEFRKRRGYDLKPHLPALVADVGPRTADIRHDWGKTLTELLEDRFLTPMRDWAMKNRTKFRIQGYGIPPAVVSSNSFAGIPEGEGSQWRIVRASRWAASASHLYGRPVASSETWTWLHSPVFRATPLDLKAEADLHFLQGVNQLIGHGWPYTPEGEEYPGWRFYAAGVFNDKNPWWIAMPDLARYLQRVSHMLRQGKAANDVALYLPNSDAWSSFTAGHVHMIDILRERVGAQAMGQILDAGYGLDFFDDRTLDPVLRLGYRVIVLPGVERMPLATIRRLEEFAGRGGILVATKRTPSTAPGLMTSESDRAEVREISRRLFEGATARARLAPEESALGRTLNSLLAPDMGLSAATSEIGFVHRTTDFGEIYFVANVGNTSKNLRATFRVTGREPEWWDATTGAITPVAVLDWANGATTIALDLAPYESRVLVFARRSGPFAAPPAMRPIGRPVDISTGWKVTFASGGSPVQMDTLRSWTDDEHTRFYSGTAAYEKEVTVPPELIRPDTRIALDFGEGRAVAETRRTNGMRAWLDGPVREAAVVYVNGRRAGSVWRPPYKVDVTPMLKPGANQVRIVVANLAVNHMAGRAPPDYRLLHPRYGARFEAQDMDRIEPVASGLLGPIRLIASGM
ncbi:MAG: glycosyl hydrolase [Bryobacteraceae bacterium]